MLTYSVQSGVILPATYDNNNHVKLFVVLENDEI